MLTKLNKRNNNNKGFSLIEVLIAVAIMAIVTLPLANSFVTSSKVNNKSEVKLAATTVAENTMEQAKSLDLSEKVKSEDGKYYIDADEPVIENNEKFDVRTIIDPTKYAETNDKVYDLSTIDVPVTAKYTAPDKQNSKVNKYDISITISRDYITDEVTVTGTTTQWKNKTLKYEETSLIYQYAGDYDALRNIQINFKEENKFNLRNIYVYNYENVVVYITLNELDTHDQGNDSVDIYENYKDEDWLTTVENDRIPFTRFIENDNDKENFHYHSGYKNNDNKLKDTMFYGFEGQESSAETKELIYGVNVSVYEFSSKSEDKYSDDKLITYLDGSKIVD